LATRSSAAAARSPFFANLSFCFNISASPEIYPLEIFPPALPTPALLKSVTIYYSCLLLTPLKKQTVYKPFYQGYF
jgi:hypothetical protein